MKVFIAKDNDIHPLLRSLGSIAVVPHDVFEDAIYRSITIVDHSRYKSVCMHANLTFDTSIRSFKRSMRFGGGGRAQQTACACCPSNQSLEKVVYRRVGITDDSATRYAHMYNNVA